MVAAHASPGDFPELGRGDARDKVGAFAGISGRTVEKIAKVARMAIPTAVMAALAGRNLVACRIW
jgi:hypothetical protein